MHLKVILYTKQNLELVRFYLQMQIVEIKVINITELLCAKVGCYSLMKKKTTCKYSITVFYFSLISKKYQRKIYVTHSL